MVGRGYRETGAESDCLLGVVSGLQDEKTSGDQLPNNVNVFNTTELHTFKGQKG